MEFAGEQYGARIWRPPENRLIVVVPREDPVTVGFEQPFRTEVASYGEKPFWRCPINRGETKVVPIQAKHRHVRYLTRRKKTTPGER